MTTLTLRSFNKTWYATLDPSIEGGTIVKFFRYQRKKRPRKATLMGTFHMDGTPASCCDQTQQQLDDRADAERPHATGIDPRRARLEPRR